jgi:hypothetical protein
MDLLINHLSTVRTSDWADWKLPSTSFLPSSDNATMLRLNKNKQIFNGWFIFQLTRKERFFYCEESLKISTTNEESGIEEMEVNDSRIKAGQTDSRIKAGPNDSRIKTGQNDSKFVDKEDEIVMEDDSVIEVSENEN